MYMMPCVVCVGGVRAGKILDLSYIYNYLLAGEEDVGEVDMEALSVGG